MEITTKNRAVIPITLLILGLGGCASTPKPWAEANNSPWPSKHEAGATHVSADKTESTVTLKDAALLADPEPVIMAPPEAIPAPDVIIAADKKKMTSAQKILALPITDYVVQVYASKTMASMERFKTEKELTDLMTVRTDRKGNAVYILIDIHPDFASASQAATYLEKRTGSKPWIRSVAGLQKVVVVK